MPEVEDAPVLAAPAPAAAVASAQPALPEVVAAPTTSISSPVAEPPSSEPFAVGQLSESPAPAKSAARRRRAPSRRTDAPVVDGPVHRPLIRATLPRPEGQKDARPAPDFTARHVPQRGTRRIPWRPGPHAHARWQRQRQPWQQPWTWERLRQRQSHAGRSALPGQPAFGAESPADGPRRRTGFPQRQWQRERQQARPRLPRINTGPAHRRSRLFPFPRFPLRPRFTFGSRRTLVPCKSSEAAPQTIEAPPRRSHRLITPRLDARDGRRSGVAGRETAR